MTEKQIKEFLWDLYYLLEGKVPLGQALEVLTDQQGQKFAEEILKNVKEGYSLAQSMDKAGFKNSYIIQVLKVAEKGDFLAEGLLDICNLLEEKDKLKGKVINSLIYPLILIFFALFTIVFTFTYVIPSVVKVYNTLGVEKNFFVVFFLNFNLGYFIIGGLITLFIYNYWLFYRKRTYQLLLIGKLLLYKDKYLFYKMLGNLLSKGVPLYQGLEILKEFSQGLKDGELEQLLQGLFSGKSFYKSLAIADFDDGKVINFIKVAEESGDLTSGVVRVEKYYQRLLDKQLVYFGKILEPLIISGVGITVLVIVTTLLYPIYGLLRSM